MKAAVKQKDWCVGERVEITEAKHNGDEMSADEASNDYYDKS